MNDNTGERITDVAVLDRVVETGSIVMRRGPVDSLAYGTRLRGLRRAANHGWSLVYSVIRRTFNNSEEYESTPTKPVTGWSWSATRTTS